MKANVCPALVVALALVGFCQNINPPIDARTNIQGFPSSRDGAGPRPLKILTKEQEKFWQARVAGNAKEAKKLLGKATVTSFTGATDANQLISQIETGVCKVIAFKLSDFRLQSPNATSQVLTYRISQNGICNGKQLPPAIQVSVAYWNTDGTWSVAYYVEEIPGGSTAANQLSH